MSILDIDSLVQPRREAIDDEYDYSTHGRFIEKCDSYSEYVLKCCIDGIEPIVTPLEFDDVKSGLIGFCLPSGPGVRRIYPGMFRL